MYMVEKSGKLLCRIVLIMLLFVLCFCASCGHKEARYALDMAEKRMWDEPDSALKVLESIVMPEDLEGKELADYALLLTQAQYRSNIVATSDSLINIAVGYYQDKDVEKRTASLLYKGGVLKDMGKDEEAMLVYKEAESYILNYWIWYLWSILCFRQKYIIIMESIKVRKKNGRKLRSMCVRR